MPALTQICLHALSLSQELSSGPSLLSHSDARKRSAPSRQPLGVIHKAPTAGPPRRRQRVQRPSGGRCGMASGRHGARDPRPSRRHGQHWYWYRLRRHGGNFWWTRAAARAIAQKVAFLRTSGVLQSAEMTQLQTCGAKVSRRGEHGSWADRCGGRASGLRPSAGLYSAMGGGGARACRCCPMDGPRLVLDSRVWCPFASCGPPLVKPRPGQSSLSTLPAHA